MTATSIEIGEDLRRILRTARTAPERWGTEKGLTQDQAARGAGISPVLYRNLENGYYISTKVPTLVGICEFLGIDPDFLERQGYQAVAEELRLRLTLGNKVILDLDRLNRLTPGEEAFLRDLLDKLIATPAPASSLQGVTKKELGAA
jgi:transcriptional regulator with XRE-family HTH domain